MGIQQQARALGDPTRYDIFRYVAEAERSVDVAELTKHFGLNHNAIRQHLAKLVAAALIEESTAPTAGRGRPRLNYSLHPTAESRWGLHGPYERLSLWLAEVVRTGDAPVEVGRRVGREQLSGVGQSGDPVEGFVAQMAEHGFDPTSSRQGKSVEVTLRSCPFESTALADPGSVCELHRGIAQGVAEGLGGLVVDELVARDPRQADCVLRCHLEAAP